MLVALGLLCLGWALVVALFKGIAFASEPLWTAQVIGTLVLASGLPSLICAVVASRR